VPFPHSPFPLSPEGNGGKRGKGNGAPIISTFDFVDAKQGN